MTNDWTKAMENVYETVLKESIDTLKRQLIDQHFCEDGEDVFERLMESFSKGIHEMMRDMKEEATQYINGKVDEWLNGLQ